jgi:enamine deaminase RidA (YjgF/YER057c/UK114 family)
MFRACCEVEPTQSQLTEENNVPGRNVDYLNPGTACAPSGLYSQVAKVDSGPLAFIAGQHALDAHGNCVGIYDFDAQFEQVFENLGAVLEGLNAGFEDIVKLTTYLVQSEHIEKFMRARAALFPRLFANESYPPNTLVVVDCLVKEELLIEVEAVARV